MRLTSNIIHNAPNVICRGTDTLTNTHIFGPDSGISSHSFGRSYSGDATCNFLHHDRMERVSGHVLFNMAAACLSSYGRSPISGTQAQRHFIQRLASSISGESCPLLYMESSLFPRIFYHSSSNDSYSILGALPLFVYSSTSRTHMVWNHSSKWIVHASLTTVVLPAAALITSSTYMISCLTRNFAIPILVM